MPIRKLESLRPGARPFYFFKGTLAQAKKTSLTKIANALEKASGKPVDLRKESDAKWTEQFKTDVTNHLSKMVQYGIKESHAVFYTPIGFTYFKMTVDGKKALVHQYPLTHGITSKQNYQPRLEALEEILEKGFSGNESSLANATHEEKRRVQTIYATPAIERQTMADRYYLELMATQGNPIANQYSNQAHVRQAPPDQILRVNIALAKLPKEQLEARKKFYLGRLKKYGVPISFIA